MSFYELIYILTNIIYVLTINKLFTNNNFRKSIKNIQK